MCVAEHELHFAGQLAKFLAQLGSHGLPEIPADVVDLGFAKYVAIAFALAFGGASRGQIDPGADKIVERDSVFQLHLRIDAQLRVQPSGQPPRDAFGQIVAGAGA